MDEIKIRRITGQFVAARSLYEKGELDQAGKELKLILEEVEKIYDIPGHRYYSFEHELEVYYFTYLKNAGKKLDELQVEFAEVEISAYYRLYGMIQIAKAQKTGTDRKLEEAVKSFDRALYWNPVDVDAYFQQIELYKALGRLDSVKKAAFEVYPYCCTRASVAHFYRVLGFYYLEKYKPETAVALYQYSNIFYHNEKADEELSYLSKALDRKIPQMEVADIQKVLTEAQIPAGPSKQTVEITYGVAELEYNNEHYEIARDCYAMVYDLTQDEKVEDKLRQINAILKL